MITLVVAVAAVSAGVLLLVRLRRNYNYPGITWLLYQTVFFASFGLYVLWGEGFIRHVLMPHGAHPIYDQISGFVGLMGIPFIVAGWFMVLRLTASVCAFRINLPSSFIFLLGNMFLVVALGILFPSLLKFVFPFLNIAYFLLAGFLIYFSRKKGKQKGGSTTRTWFSAALILAGIFMSVPKIFIANSMYLDIGIILAYFIGLSFPVAILILHPGLQPEQLSEDDRFARFCKTYEISAREAELIREILQGKSNKEIAQAKFITLQTVKDHIHNIFIKTDVKSRIQLANKVRELD